MRCPPHPMNPLRFLVHFLIFAVSALSLLAPPIPSLSAAHVNLSRNHDEHFGRRVQANSSAHQPHCQWAVQVRGHHRQGQVLPSEARSGQVRQRTHTTVTRRTRCAPRTNFRLQLRDTDAATGSATKRHETIPCSLRCLMPAIHTHFTFASNRGRHTSRP